MSASTASSDRASPLLLPYRRRPQSPATAVATGPPPPPVSHHPTRVPPPLSSAQARREGQRDFPASTSPPITGIAPWAPSPARDGPQGQFWLAQLA
jgi:hypothetical protein